MVPTLLPLNFLNPLRALLSPHFPFCTNVSEFILLCFLMLDDSLLFGHNLIQILQDLLLLFCPAGSVMIITQRLNFLVHELSFASHILILPISGFRLPVFHFDL